MLPLLLACRADPEPKTQLPAPSPTPSGPPTTTAACADPGFPVLHVADPAAAARGEALLTDGVLGEPLIPRVALRSLWAVWGGLPPGDDAYWRAFRDRYGLVEAPWDNDGYPLGLHAVDGTWATVDCLLCHADTAGGEVIVGVGNSRLDLQALFDDLVSLGDLGTELGLPEYPLPYELVGVTGAAGSTDAFGLAMQLSLAYGPPGVGLHTTYGYQQSAPWWTLASQDSQYADGAGTSDNPRTMAATLLGFGTTMRELEASEPELADLQQWLWSLRPPPWPLGEDPRAERGRAVYVEAGCGGCHGDPCGGAFPDVVIPADEVGTDPLRAESFGDREAAWVNASWFGEPAAMRATGGYVAPSLLGVWATAPYLHDGAVPDLWSVLDTSSRPASWRRTGTDPADYDIERGGWRYEEVAPPADRTTPEARRIVDTSLPGLSAAGHAYGDDLSDDDRAALVAWLLRL